MAGIAVSLEVMADYRRIAMGTRLGRTARTITHCKVFCTVPCLERLNVSLAWLRVFRCHSGNSICGDSKRNDA